MSKGHIKRIVSVSVVLILILALFPASVFACAPKAAKAVGSADASGCTCTVARDVSVKIVWNDNNNAAGKRPQQYVKMQLFTDPVCPLAVCKACKFNKVIELTPKNKWSWSQKSVKSADQLVLVAPEVPQYSKSIEKKSGSVVFEVTYTYPANCGGDGNGDGNGNGDDDDDDDDDGGNGNGNGNGNGGNGGDGGNGGTPTMPASGF